MRGNPPRIGLKANSTCRVCSASQKKPALASQPASLEKTSGLRGRSARPRIACRSLRSFSIRHAHMRRSCNKIKNRMLLPVRTAWVLSSRSRSGSAYLLRLAVNTITSYFVAISVCRGRISGQPGAFLRAPRCGRTRNLSTNGLLSTYTSVTCRARRKVSAERFRRASLHRNRTFPSISTGIM